jgi:hypothetical protein
MDVPDLVWNLRPKYKEQEAMNISNAPELLTLVVTRLAKRAIELTNTKVAEMLPLLVDGSLTTGTGNPNSLAF